MPVAGDTEPYIALAFHEFFRHSDMVGLAAETGGMGMMASNGRGEAVGLRPDGLAFKVLHDHFAEALPVAVNGNSPQKPIKGVAGIDTSAKSCGGLTYPLDVFAALSADRKTIAISVVNPTEAEQNCELKLSGVQPTGQCRIRQITAPPGAAAAPVGRGGVGGVPATAAQETLPEVPGKITVPAASITVYDFAVR